MPQSTSIPMCSNRVHLLLILPTLFLMAVVSGCQQSTPVTVNHAGALMEIMMQGKTHARVMPDTLIAGTPNLWALGATTDLKGEWLIRQSQPHLSQVQEGKLVHTKGAEQTAALLVWSQVSEWKEQDIPSGLDQKALGDWIVNQSEQHGLSPDSPFPIRLMGEVDTLAWHVINVPDSLLTQALGHAAHQRHAMRGQLAKQEVEIFGFFSTKHERVYTHMGDKLHLHIFLDPGNAHIDEMKTGEGMKILWPKEG